MGWWKQDEEGQSFAHADFAVEMLWGDHVADIMDNAVAEIIKVYEQFLDRRPTKAEMIAGLKFSLGTFDENMQDLEPTHMPAPRDKHEAQPGANPDRKDVES